MTNPYYAGTPSDHFDGERFFNPGLPAASHGFGKLLRWRFRGERPVWTETVTRPIVPARAEAGLVVTMIGHASLLIQIAGRNILIDPVWSERASPVSWAGPRRMNAPGIAFDDLPPIDTVLITHNHYDHLDAATLRRLAERHGPRLIAPLGNDRVIARAGIRSPVETLDWHQSLTLDGGVAVTLHPAYHWSARGVSDRRMALWGGYVIEAPGRLIYHAGDTAYGDGRIFRACRERYGAPDLAIIPIGAYEPRWIMRQSHVDPAEAVRIMLDCGATQALGVHWGTFPLSDEPQQAPAGMLRAELARLGLAEDRFIPLRPAETWPPRASG